jgi:vancomycin resistance protein VanW
MLQSLHLQLRRLVRTLLPPEFRLRLRLARRALEDQRSQVRFARSRLPRRSFAHVWSTGSARLRVYEGQAATAEGKRRNIGLFASALDGLVIERGETLSLWDTVGRPTTARGYQPAAALRNGQLITEVGGAVCLVSTVIYRAALEASLVPIERRSHSVDSYGEQRYFELGLDATVEYGYIDLRLRNDGADPLRLGVVVREDRVEVTFAAAKPRSHHVALEVHALPAPRGHLRVAAERITSNDRGQVRREQLGESLYRLPADVAARPPQAASARSGRSSLPS